MREPIKNYECRIWSDYFQDWEQTEYSCDAIEVRKLESDYKKLETSEAFALNLLDDSKAKIKDLKEDISLIKDHFADYGSIKKQVSSMKNCGNCFHATRDCMETAIGKYCGRWKRA